MARGFTISHPGSYTVKMDGAVIGSFQSQSYYETLVRSDPRPGGYVLGMRIPTAYTASKTVHLGPNGTWVRRQYGRLYNRSGDLYNLSSGSNLVKGWTVPAFDSGLQSAALIKLYERLKALSTSVNLATNLAEGKQSIDMITSMLKTALTAYRHARKGFLRDVMYGIGKRDGSKSWRKALRTLGLHGTKPAQNLGGRVLQFNLGIAPLAGDMHQAVQDYMKSGPNAVFITRVDGSAGSPKLGPSKQYIDDQGYLPMTVSYQEANFAKARLYVRLRHPSQASAAALGLTNPLSVAWELVGLSWIVDYAIDIGGWLNAIDAPLGWVFVTGYMSLRAESKATFSGLSSPTSGQSIISGERRNFAFKRAVYDTFPVPALPDFKNPVSLKHALNVVALFGVYHGKG